MRVCCTRTNKKIDNFKVERKKSTTFYVVQDISLLQKKNLHVSDLHIKWNHFGWIESPFNSFCHISAIFGVYHGKIHCETNKHEKSQPKSTREKKNVKWKWRCGIMISLIVNFQFKKNVFGSMEYNQHNFHETKVGNFSEMQAFKWHTKLCISPPFHILRYIINITFLLNKAIWPKFNFGI